MPSGRTPTDVANKALGLLGEGRTILTLDDPTPRARLLRRQYPTARDEALAAYDWNEATKIVQLSATPDIETGSYAAAFLTPGDYLRWIPWDREDDNAYVGEIVGRYLLANPGCPSVDSDGFPETDSVLFRYVFRLEQVALWSTGLEAAVAAKLAFYCARAITGRSSDQQAMSNLFESEIVNAKHQDARANNKQAKFATRARYHSNWLAVRRGRRLR
ncbi:MAG TPA: hypothetical protein VFW22_16470 [Pseudolabrys sp.]|nr:hypothetical protein [Pseudolabrys sp.]